MFPVKVDLTIHLPFVVLLFFPLVLTLAFLLRPLFPSSCICAIYCRTRLDRSQSDVLAVSPRYFSLCTFSPVIFPQGPLRFFLHFAAHDLIQVPNDPAVMLTFLLGAARKHPSEVTRIHHFPRMPWPLACLRPRLGR